MPRFVQRFGVEVAFDLFAHDAFAFVALAAVTHEDDVVAVGGFDGFADAADALFFDGLRQFAAELVGADPAEVAAFGRGLGVFGVAAGQAGEVGPAL